MHDRSDPIQPPGASWQVDLLAFGRARLERLSARLRFRHLYPDGPNFALLFAAYQAIERQVATGRIRASPRILRRRLARELSRRLEDDAACREAHVAHQIPPPVRHPIRAHLPDAVARALAQVDADVRQDVARWVASARLRPPPGSDQSLIDPRHTQARFDRGRAQFRTALLYELLKEPAVVPRLHPELLAALDPPYPPRLTHPVAVAVLLKAPLYLWMTLVVLFNVAYLAAFVFFNDAVLGRFVSTQVSSILQGELEIREIHWRPRLIVDFLLGHPTPLVARGVSIYEPFKDFVDERGRKAVVADEVHLSMTLHEIIPWTRLGVPTFFDVPWILHFGDVRIDDPVTFWIRRYPTKTTDGRDAVVLGLRDAFLLHDLTPDPTAKGLSVALDDAALSRIFVEIDDTPLGGWRAAFDAKDANVWIDFEAPEPGTDDAGPIPFRFHVGAVPARGLIEIAGRRFQIGRGTTLALDAGHGPIADGDVGVHLSAPIERSPATVVGRLRDVFRYDDAITKVEVTLDTPDAGGLVGAVQRRLGIDDRTVDATGRPAHVTIVGPMSAPDFLMDLSAETVDLFDEPAWVARTVRARVLAHRRGVAPDLRTPAVGPDDTRWQFLFSDLDAEVLGGRVTLVDPPGTIVLPDLPDEPWYLAARFALDEVDPAGLVAGSQPDLAASLAGTASGGLGVELEILASTGPSPPAANRGETNEAPPSTSLAAALTFDNVHLRRRRGPSEDGLPTRIGLSGRVAIDHDGSIATDGFRISAPGGRAVVSGEWAAPAGRIRGGDLDVEVSDGAQTARAFGWPPLFQRLHASLRFAGPPARLSGPAGSLSVAGVGLPGSPGGTIPSARLWIEAGTLKLRAPRGALLGGTGRVDVDLVLASRGRFLETPRVRATVDLDGIDLSSLFGADVRGAADLRIDVANDHGKPVPIDAIEARAALYARSVTVRGHTFAGAQAQLRVTPETVDIERLSLPFHRQPSPFHAPSVSIPIGRVDLSGSVGLSTPHPLDLDVQAGGVPLGLLTSMFVDESPIFAQIAPGTRLRVGGTAVRPSAHGTVRVVGVHVGGLDLGAGELRIDSADIDRAGPLAAHRELRIEGDLATPNGDLQARLDALLAIGQDGTVDAQGTVYVPTITLDHLLRSLEGPQTGLPQVVAGIEGLGASLLACGGTRPMISDCAARRSHEATLGAQVSAERLFVVSRASYDAARGPACDGAVALCSVQSVRANVTGTKIQLERPVELRTRAGRAVTVAGSFDLAPPRATGDQCLEPGSQRPSAPGGGHATVRGVLDLAPVAPLWTEAVRARGAVAIDLSVDGPLLAPTLSGSVRRTGGSEPIEIHAADLPPVELDRLELRPVGDDLLLEADGRFGDDPLRILSRPDVPTFLTYRGPCAGRYAVHVEGALPADVAGDPLPGGWRVEGSARVAQAFVAGRLGGKAPVHRAEVDIRFGGRHHLRIAAPVGIEPVEIRRGMLVVRYCRKAPCPSGLSEGEADALVAGAIGVEAERPPPTALEATVGSRGRAVLWGRAAYDLDAGAFTDARIRTTLRDISVRTYDGRGRAELVATISSPDMRLLGATPSLLRGTISVEDARWVKNALESVGLLSFFDNAVEAPSPPPGALRDLSLDLDVATVAPLRVDNNIAEGVEARFEVHVGGTYDRPEFRGRLDLEPGGVVRLPFVGGSFEIQQGRVDLERVLEEAFVDVLAERQEPIYVDGQPRRFTIRLRGPLRAIAWECDTGILDQNRAVAAATDECVNYLLLGAGDVPAPQTAQGNASSGLLYARKGMNVVGNVAEVNVARQVVRAVPRLAPYMPDVRLRLGQLGPEIDVRTPRSWFDFDYGHATVGFGYTRGYPGFLLRANRDLSFRLRVLDAFSIEARRSRRSYLNQRVVFDPLEQGVFEATIDLEVPSLR